MGFSLAGLRSASPNRRSNRLEPTATVTVNPSDSTTGPSTALSAGGSPMPKSGGVPPSHRNRARAVSVLNAATTASLFFEVTSKAT
ncbi:Uncharacterised protein [Mycobacteroides abscessus subsp. massiliense]|nr:Uncharacterised protein [Mycobacteroides abscessus subsp. massiliense]